MSRLFPTSRNRHSDFRASHLLREKNVTCPANFIEFLKKHCNLQSALPKLVQNANISSFSDKPKPSYFNSSMQCLVFFWQAKTVVLIFALLSYCEKKIVTCPANFIEFLKNLCNLQSALPKLVQNANISSFSDKPKPSYFNSSMQCLVFFWQAKTVVLPFALLGYCEKKIVTCPAKFIEFLKKICNLHSALPKLVQNANVSSFSDKPKPSYFNSSMHCLVFLDKPKLSFWFLRFSVIAREKLLLHHQEGQQFPFSAFSNCQIGLLLIVASQSLQQRGIIFFSNQSIVVCIFFSVIFLVQYLVFLWETKTVVLTFVLLSYCEKKMLLVLQHLLNFWKNIVISKVPFLN